MAKRPLLQALLVLALIGCSRDDDGALAIVFIADAESLFADGVRLSPGAQTLRAATGVGLVSFGGQGEVIPGLADRWIVTEDGRSYIFRLRDGTWPDGQTLTAESARAALQQAIARLRGTSLGLDLAPVEDVRAMAGRVIEIRLSSPVPSMLQLLAQPELTLQNGDEPAGDMLLRREGARGELTMKPPQARGLPEPADWRTYVRPILVSAAPAASALEQFDDGTADIVLGGRIEALPLVETGPLSRGTVRLDPAIGLFGLQVRRARGLLADAEGREVLLLALDRESLIEPFGVGGWTPTMRIVAPGLPNETNPVIERWAAVSLEARREIAARRVAAWRSANGGTAARLTVAMGEGPGLDQLFRALVQQLAPVGVALTRAAPGTPADLELVDRVARYAEPRWFLNQFNCSLRNGLCSSEADALVRDAILQDSAASRAALYAQAETELARANVFIAFGSPLRFSLVRGDVDGFAANTGAFHPLPPLATLPR